MSTLWIDRYRIEFPLLHGMSRDEKASVFGGVGGPRIYVVLVDSFRHGRIGARRLDELELAADSLCGGGG